MHGSRGKQYVERSERENRNRLWYAYTGADERDKCRCSVPFRSARDNSTSNKTVRQVGDRCFCAPFSSCLFAFSNGNKKGIAKEQDDQINVENGKDGQQDHQQDVIGFEFENKEGGISGDGAAEEPCDKQF